MRWRALRGHTEPVSDVAFSADGLMLLTASADTSARVWQIESDTGIRDLPPHRQGVRSATFSKDGRQVLTAGEDSRAWIWDVDRSRIVATFGSDERPVTCAIFSPNDQMVVTVTANAGLAAVWSAGDGGFIAGLPHDTPLYAAAFMPDSRFLATAGHDGSMTIWDTRTWTKVGSFGRHHRRYVRRRLQSQWRARRLGRRGRRRASLNDDRNLGQQAPRTDGTHWPGQIGRVRFERQATRVCQRRPHRDRVGRRKGDASPASSGHTAPVQHAVFSPDDQYIATASRDLTARIWDARTGAQVATLFGHAGPVYDVAFSRDQRFIVTASGDRTVKMYRWETFAPVDELWPTVLEPTFRTLSGDKELAAYVEPPVQNRSGEPPSRGRSSPPRVHGEGRMMRIDTVLRQRALITILTLIVIHGCGSGGSSDPSRNGAITMQVRWQGANRWRCRSAATDAGCVDAEPVDTAGFGVPIPPAARFIRIVYVTENSRLLCRLPSNRSAGGRRAARGSLRLIGGRRRDRIGVRDQLRSSRRHYRHLRNGFVRRTGMRGGLQSAELLERADVRESRSRGRSWMRATFRSLPCRSWCYPTMPGCSQDHGRRTHPRTCDSRSPTRSASSTPAASTPSSSRSRATDRRSPSSPTRKPAS